MEHASELRELFAAVNTPGIHDALDANRPPCQQAIHDFRRLFMSLTGALFVPEKFKQQVESRIADGTCFDSPLLPSHISSFRPSVTPQPFHETLPDCHSYSTKDRPFLHGRTWYTEQERRHACRFASAYPEVPLAHMTLLALAQEHVIDSVSDANLPKGDVCSYLLRWSSSNTANDVVPAVSISLFGSRLADLETADRDSAFARALASDIVTPESICSAYDMSKDFLFNGGFFRARFPGEDGKYVHALCPGHEFMRIHWNVLGKICSASLAANTPAQPFVQALRERFTEAEHS